MTASISRPVRASAGSKGTVHHYSVRSLGEQMAKLNGYSDAQADDLDKRGETLSVFRLVARVPGQLHQGLYRPAATRCAASTAS